MSAFKPDDEVELTTWPDANGNPMAWDPTLVGKRFRLSRQWVSLNPDDAHLGPLWILHSCYIISGGEQSWPEKAMRLVKPKTDVDLSEHPTQRSMPAIRPQWVVAREACIDPKTECRKCGAPINSLNPCKYHPEG